MNSLYIVVVALVVLVVLGLLWWRSRADAGDASPSPGGPRPGYVDTVAGWSPQATRVLTNAERSAYETLRAAFPSHVILAQVPLARFIKVPTRNSYAEWLRRAGQLCADLVVCDVYTQVIAVIELRLADDMVSERAGKRHKRLERVLKAAEIPVHFWNEQAMPSVAQARESILPSLHEPDAPITVPGALGPASSPSRVPPVAKGVPEDIEDEETGMREPPPSTWFDDMDTAPAPLTPPRRGR